ncbi:hypothetical protein [Moraxella lacunata]|uniref:hypothetical protein n=1 Tax=Moraxella lacunata TaxID=477 RepID=UPI003EE2C12D
MPAASIWLDTARLTAPSFNSSRLTVRSMAGFRVMQSTCVILGFLSNGQGTHFASTGAG